MDDDTGPELGRKVRALISSQGLSRESSSIHLVLCKGSYRQETHPSKDDRWLTKPSTPAETFLMKNAIAPSRSMEVAVHNHTTIRPSVNRNEQPGNLILLDPSHRFDTQRCPHNQPHKLRLGVTPFSPAQPQGRMSRQSSTVPA